MKNTENKKQPQLISIINICSIILIVIIALAFIFVLNTSSQLAKPQTDRYNLTLNANLFIDASERLTNEVRAYATTGNTVNYDNYIKESNVDKNTDVSVSKMKEIGITSEEEEIINEMLNLSLNLVPLEMDAMNMVKAGNNMKAINFVYGQDYNDTVSKIASLKSEFITMLDNRTAAVVTNLNNILTMSQYLVLSLVVILVLLQLWLNLVIKKRLLSPIKQINRELNKITMGEIFTPVVVEGNVSEVALIVDALNVVKKNLHIYISDISMVMMHISQGNFDIPELQQPFVGDFKVIEDSIHKITKDMSQTIHSIRLSATQVSNSSEQVSSSSQYLAKGATEQAASVEELSSSVAEVSTRIKENAENTVMASKMSTEVGSDVIESNNHMKDMRAAIDEISGKSNEIGRIIKTIDDIAFQTNILALNAAVEAARAGVAGKGFSVVADEVRSLAQKSAEAAKNTTELIQSTIEAVKNGIAISHETEKSLHVVVEKISNITKTIQDVADSSDEQSAAMQQINQGIDQICNVIQTSSSTTEQSAAASQELRQQSQTLEGLVSKFKLKSNKSIF